MPLYKGRTDGKANEWYTPPVLADAAREVMGSIDLDPASCAIANSDAIRAKRFYTAEDNGLVQPWAGNVWLNPPYTPAELQRKFLATLVWNYRESCVTQAVVLLNNPTEVAWWQEFAREASAICFPARRVRFWNEQGTAAPPLQGQSVFYFGERTAEFARVFGRGAGGGLVVKPVS